MPRKALLILFFCCLAASPAAQFRTFQASRAIIGQPTFTSQLASPSQSLLGGVGGLALAGNNLVVVDSNVFGATPVNHRVLIYHNISSVLPTPDADLPQSSPCPICVGTADTVLGQPDFTTTLPGVQNGLNAPTAAASDGARLAIADTNNNRVLIWNSIPSTINQPPDVVVGQPDFKTTAPGTSQSVMRGPEGVWFSNGRLIVADTFNSRVLIYSAVPGSNGAKADVVLGQPDFNTRPSPNLDSSNYTPTASNMLSPVSATTTPDGSKLLVADLGFNRVLIFNNVPSSNAAPADLVLGQPDMTSGLSNNAAPAGPPTSIDAAGNLVYSSTTSLCSPVYNDSNSNPVYPFRCLATMSMPRFVLSDGHYVFIADGGNDRILVYNTFPTGSGAAADVVLGQPDPTLLAPDSSGAGSLQTPASLAWDGTDLFVADSFNRRVLVFTPATPLIASGGVVNGASYVVYATEGITFSGTVAAGDVATLTIRSNAYAYTAVTGDTLPSVRDNLLKLINANDPFVIARAGADHGVYAIGSIQFSGAPQPGDVITVTMNGTSYSYTAKAGDSQIVSNLVFLINLQYKDPNVYAAVSLTDPNTLTLTARQLGEAGNSVTYSVSISSGSSITATAFGANLTGGSSQPSMILIARTGGTGPNSYTVNGTSSNSALSISNPNATMIGGNDASQSAPGTQISIFGNNLALQAVSASLTQNSLPTSLGGAEVFVNGLLAPLYMVSPTQINAQVPFALTGEAASVYLRLTQADGSVVYSIAEPILAPPAAPGIYSFEGSEPRQAVVVHGQQFSQGRVLIQYNFGSSTAPTAANPIPAGIVLSITVDGRTYNYTTIASDTLANIQQQLINAVNAGQGDPEVVASAGAIGIDSASVTIDFGGTLTPGNTVAITIDGRIYTYTIQATDGLAAVANKLIALIDTSNNGIGDPEVVATPDSTTGKNGLVITARVPGDRGNNISFSVALSSGATITFTASSTTGFLINGAIIPEVVLTARAAGKAGDSIQYSANAVQVSGSLVTVNANAALPNLCCANGYFTLVTQDNPAEPGEEITIFATGLGLTNPNFMTSGQPVPLAGGPFLVPLNPNESVTATAGGKSAIVDFVGLAPGQIGVYQLNLILNTAMEEDPITLLNIAQGNFVSNTATFAVHNPIPNNNIASTTSTVSVPVNRGGTTTTRK